MRALFCFQAQDSRASSEAPGLPPAWAKRFDLGVVRMKRSRFPRVQRSFSACSISRSPPYMQLRFLEQTFDNGVYGFPPVRADGVGRRLNRSCLHHLEGSRFRRSVSGRPPPAGGTTYGSRVSLPASTRARLSSETYVRSECLRRKLSRNSLNKTRFLMSLISRLRVVRTRSFSSLK